MPRASYKNGRYACSTISTTVTKEAIITINAGILTLSGMIFRSREIIALLSASTTIVVSPMPSPFMAEVVTASVGHMPSISTSVGFSLKIPLYSRSPALFWFIAQLPLPTHSENSKALRLPPPPRHWS